MASDDFRLGIIGTGNIAKKRHVPAVAELKSNGLDDFVVSTVCDIDEEGAEAFADDLEQRFGLRPTVYTDHRDLLKDGATDGVDLCLPHNVHHTIAVDCLEAGVPVLCEKPLGITMRGAQRMVDAADRNDVPLSTAVQMRRTLGQRTAHWILNQSGLIGDPLTFFLYFTGPLREAPKYGQIPPRRVWRRNRLISGGRHILDAGFHYCDSIRYLLGEVKTVHAEAREFATGEARSLAEGIEDAVYATMTFESGVLGIWAFGLILPGAVSQETIFYGSQGSLQDTGDNPYRVFHLFGEDTGLLTKTDGTEISYDELEKMYLASLDEGEKQTLFPNGVTNGFALEVWEFMEVVRGRREKPEVDGWEGLRSQAVCEAIYESAYTGRVITIADVIAGKERAYQAPIDEHWGL